MERGGRAVVRDVSVEIATGQVTALLGPNGAGKSTLVLAVGGVLRPRSGTVLLDGADIAGRRPERIRQAGVAIVPEGRRLLPDLTVEDNLRVASYALTREQAQAGRDRVLELFPQLGQRLTATARTLSGGEQQMVVLAQALITQPRYLLIDELSLGLAPVVVSRLIPVIAAVAESGTGVLLIEQFATVALGLAHQRPHHGGRPDPLLRPGQRAARAARTAQLRLPAPRRSSDRSRAPAPRVRAMINICFAGVTGWTAPPILAAIDAAEDLTLTSGVSRSAAGQGAVYATAAEALAAAPADVLVDFTSAAAVRGNVRAAIEAGVHVVIGTSGLTAGRLRRDRPAGPRPGGRRDRGRELLGHGRRAAPRRHDGRGAHRRLGDHRLRQRHQARRAQRHRPRSRRDPGPGPRAGPRRAARRPGGTGRGARARRSAGPGSTRSGCPASWSAPRWSSPGRGSGWSCGTTRA